MEESEVIDDTRIRGLPSGRNPENFSLAQAEEKFSLIEKFALESEGPSEAGGGDGVPSYIPEDYSCQGVEGLSGKCPPKADLHTLSFFFPTQGLALPPGPRENPPVLFFEAM